MPQTRQDALDILVVGAGELGSNVIRALAARADREGARISVLLRPDAALSPSPARRALLEELAALNVAVVHADIAASDTHGLARVFGAFHTVVNCTGFVGGPGTQLKLGSAVLEAGVARYVPWQFGIDYDSVESGSTGGLFDEQIAVRALLRAQRSTRWLIVSTGMFTSFLFEPAFGVVDLERLRVNALGSWDTRVTVTAPGDIGRLTADILFTQPVDRDSIFFTAGETLSYGRLADLVEQRFQARVERIEWSVSMLEHELARQPRDTLRKYRLAFAREPGVAWDFGTTYNAQRGLASEAVARFLLETRRNGL